jgi:hypothetical protein
MDLVVRHELRGVTPEMIDWWWDNIDTTERYRMWHPDSHLTFEWEEEAGYAAAQAISRCVYYAVLIIGSFAAYCRQGYRPPSPHFAPPGCR